MVVAMVDKSRQEKGKEKEDRENPQTNMMVISSTRVLSSGFHVCHTSPELIIVPVFCREAIYLKLSYATCQITQVEWETLAGLPEATECSGRIQTDMGGDWIWQVDTQLSRVLSLNLDVRGEEGAGVEKQHRVVCARAWGCVSVCVYTHLFVRECSACVMVM